MLITTHGQVLDQLDNTSVKILFDPITGRAYPYLAAIESEIVFVSSSVAAGAVVLAAKASAIFRDSSTFSVTATVACTAIRLRIAQASFIAAVTLTTKADAILSGNGTFSGSVVLACAARRLGLAQVSLVAAGAVTLVANAIFRDSSTFSVTAAVACTARRLGLARATPSSTATLGMITLREAFGSVVYDQGVFCEAVISIVATLIRRLPTSTVIAVATVIAQGTRLKLNIVQCFISNVNKSSWLGVNTLEISDELNTRNTASFILHIPIGSAKPSLGETVIFTNGVTISFAGTIDQIDEYQEGNSGVMRTTVRAVDWHQICDRRLVARVYVSQLGSVIVKDIIDRYLKLDGILGTGIYTGELDPLITKAVFNYTTATDALNQLADLTGFAWYIDYAKVLHFVPAAGNTSPWNIEEGVNAPIRDVRVTRSRDQYRNKQYVRVPRAATAVRTERFVGDFSQRNFTLAYPVAKPIERILVNGVLQTFGIRGDGTTDKDWYYQLDEKEITQNDDDTLWPPLTTLDTMEIVYCGSYSTLLFRQDLIHQGERAAVEGGTGIYEAITQDDVAEDISQVMDYADSLLRKHGELPLYVEFETDIIGLRSGQAITITMPTYELTGDFLITAISITDVYGDFLRYQVKAVQGEYRGSWLDFFKDISAARYKRAGQQFLIRDDEVLTEFMDPFADGISFSDVLTLSENAMPQFLVGVAIIAQCEV